MPAGNARRHVEHAPFFPDVGSTTVGRESRAAYPRFFEQYNAEPTRKWQIEVQRQLLKIVQMENGWDGYNSPVPRMDTAFFALLLLEKLMRPRTPIPQVVPSSVGGIQLEWHEKNIDLELHIAAPYECEMWFRDRQQPGQAPTSIELSNDFAAVMRPIQLLTTR